MVNQRAICREDGLQNGTEDTFPGFVTGSRISLRVFGHIPKHMKALFTV